MGNFQDCVFHRFHRSRKLKQNTCQQILSKFDVLNSKNENVENDPIQTPPPPQVWNFPHFFGRVPSDNIIKSDIVCSSIEDNYLPIKTFLLEILVVKHTSQINIHNWSGFFYFLKCDAAQGPIVFRHTRPQGPKFTHVTTLCWQAAVIKKRRFAKYFYLVLQNTFKVEMEKHIKLGHEMNQFKHHKSIKYNPSPSWPLLESLTVWISLVMILMNSVFLPSFFLSSTRSASCAMSLSVIFYQFYL